MSKRRDDAESFYFLADYHALVKCGDPARVQQSTLEIAASWLACGLDPDKVLFYRQSDIPEIPELTWFLTCVTAKGLLNRAHAYSCVNLCHVRVRMIGLGLTENAVEIRCRLPPSSNGPMRMSFWLKSPIPHEG